MLLDGLLSDAEIDRIADRVIERINITVDASDILEQISMIQDAIDKLGGE